MREFVDGNTAVVRAAVDAGCDFFAGYPITPATSILLEAVRELPARGGVAVQAEDEIASIGMCLAAAMAGRKVFTATSGPGMSLYSETLGLAVMGEVPIVIVNTQRMGPATGGATVTADGDIQFARWGTSGGYPIIALAPTDVCTAYVMTRHAFNLAEQYRGPVIVLSSKEIALTRQTVDFPEPGSLPVVQRRLHSGAGPYLPYRVETLGQVPAFSPIGGDHLVRFTTSIHDETGVITGDRAQINAKLQHLEKKIHAGGAGLDLIDFDLDLIDLDIDLDLEIDQIDRPVFEGASDLVLAYGVAAMAAREAVEALRAQGRAVSLCVPYTLWPVLEDRIRAAAAGARRVIVPEHNFGQYAREIERLLPPQVEVIRINRVDGALVTPAQIIQGVLS